MVTARNPISTHNVVTEWEGGYVDDGSCHSDVVGAVFTRECVGLFQWSHVCKTRRQWDLLKGKEVHQYDTLGSTLQVYPTAAGHYPAEQFPVLLRLLRILPDDVPILTVRAGCAICEKYIRELLRLRVLKKQSRLVDWAGHGHVYHARKLYHHRPFPWENGSSRNRGAVLRGSADLDLVRTTILGGTPTPMTPKADGKVVLVARPPGTARSTANHRTLMRALQGRYQNVVLFDTPAATLRADVDVFRDAAAVVAVHGAGLMNMLWCRPGTIVIELCYTAGMPCPDIYYHMAANLGLDYHVSVGTGHYDGVVYANISDVLCRLAAGIARPAPLAQ